MFLTLDKEEETANIISSKKMEIQAVTMVEKGNLSEGLNILNQAVEAAPNRPSLYNNRAHVHQYLRRFEGINTTAKSNIYCIFYKF